MSLDILNIINFLQGFWVFVKSDFWTIVLFIFGPISVLLLSICLKIRRFRLVSFFLFLFWLLSTSILFSAFLSVPSYKLDTQQLEIVELTPTPPDQIDENQLFDYLNQIRADLNINPLTKSDQLCLFAQTRLDQILANNGNLDQVQKPVYPQNLIAEYILTNLANLDTAKSKLLLLEEKHNQSTDIACLKVGQSQDGYIITLVLGSSLTHSPITITTNPIPRPTDDSTPWGKAVQIDEHTWTMKVQNDDRMSTVEELFTALNDYRRSKGVSVLTWDQKLADYADSRAKYFTSIKTTDGHAGFNDFLTNQDGFNILGFNQLGENTSYGYRMLGVHLIEWIYAGDEPHDKNQRNSIWSHVGIGIDGVSTCLIFATGKF